MTFKLYKSYSFRDKDPVIDELRTIIQDAGVTYKQITEESDVSGSCLYNWFSGTTKRPSYAAVAAVASALGYETHFVSRTKAKVYKLEPRRRKRA